MLIHECICTYFLVYLRLFLLPFPSPIEEVHIGW